MASWVLSLLPAVIAGGFASNSCELRLWLVSRWPTLAFTSSQQSFRNGNIPVLFVENCLKRLCWFYSLKPCLRSDHPLVVPGLVLRGLWLFMLALMADFTSLPLRFAWLAEARPTFSTFDVAATSKLGLRFAKHRCSPPVRGPSFKLAAFLNIQQEKIEGRGVVMSVLYALFTPPPTSTNTHSPLVCAASFPVLQFHHIVNACEEATRKKIDQICPTTSTTSSKMLMIV